MNNEILARIDAVIAAKRTSRRDASIAAGLGVDAVRDMERKPGSSPTVRTMTALAEGLGVSPDWLTFGLGEPPVFGEAVEDLEHHMARWRAIRTLTKHGLAETEAVLALFENRDAAEREAILSAIIGILRSRAPKPER